MRDSGVTGTIAVPLPGAEGPLGALCDRLRTPVHTLAGLQLPPEEILTQLDDLVADLGDDLRLSAGPLDPEMPRKSW
ncbi:hypothetical protein ABZZ80_33620 [Streptomyces sp. NPDC006356]